MGRLNIKESTKRTLLLRSANQCAFPSCDTELLNSLGQYVGNFCHIEAAEELGERFNPDQDDEQRRSYENLILLCSNHHKITNDVKMYKVETLQKMKKDHEEKIHLKGTQLSQDRIEKIINASYDETINYPQNLLAIKSSLDQYFIEDELADLVARAQLYFTCFKKVPLATRRFFAHILLISTSKDHWSEIDLRIVPSHLNVTFSTADTHYRILQNASLISEQMTDDDQHPVYAYRLFLEYGGTGQIGWLLQCIRDYYKDNDREKEFVELVAELNFNLLDE